LVPTVREYLRVRIDVGMKSDSVGCVREQRSVCGYMKNLEAIVMDTATYITSATMKKSFPIVVNPVKRCGVPAKRRDMPAVDSGSVNHAQVKLDNVYQLRL
jgi:hypothetical protein